MDKGETILDFTVIRKLGQGSFGEVLLAERGSQQVAIKRISKKQIIKVGDASDRSINCTNPSWRRKSC